ncbi:hypothetical protein DRQ50_08960 [bacterium]|nr:MAG: hypothetical protein DRQ50_08960 [bacterium]
MPFPFRALFAPALLLLFVATSASGTTWCVATTGDDSGPGTPDQPFLTIARGVDAATTGDTILIYEGTYTGAGNRDLDFLGKGLYVSGASGDRIDVIIDCGGTAAEPHYAFYFHSGEPQGTTLRALTIENAFASDTIPGAVYLEGSDPWEEALNGLGAFVDVIDCEIRSSTGSGFASAGEGCGFVLDGSRFANNAGTGAAMSATFDELLFEPGTSITRCEFVGNEGSGLYLRACALGFVITGSQFDDNGGAGAYIDTHYFNWGCGADFEDCTFNSNQWGVYGTGVTFNRCELSGNESHGGLFFEDGPLNWTDCQITANGGWGVSVDDGMSSIVFDDSLISGNLLGGVIAYGYIDFDIRWTSIIDNEGPGLSMQGGFGPDTISNSTIAGNTDGILCDTLDITVLNTVVANNSNCGLAGGYAVGWSAVTDNLLFGNAGGDNCVDGLDLLPEWGNLYLDPLFCDAAHGNYQVGGRSPCSDDEGNAVIGALGVGCDDAVAIDEIELLASWTNDGVEVRWSSSTRAFAQGAVLARMDEMSGGTDIIASWPSGEFPLTGRYLDRNAQPWHSYSYSMEHIGGSAGAEVRLERQSALPGVSGLTRIYPNPSNPQATIEYVLARDARVQLEIYDLAGRHTCPR